MVTPYNLPGIVLNLCKIGIVTDLSSLNKCLSSYDFRIEKEHLSHRLPEITFISIAHTSSPCNICTPVVKVLRDINKTENTNCHLYLAFKTPPAGVEFWSKIPLCSGASEGMYPSLSGMIEYLKIFSDKGIDFTISEKKPEGSRWNKIEIT